MAKTKPSRAARKKLNMGNVAAPKPATKRTSKKASSGPAKPTTAATKSPYDIVEASFVAALGISGGELVAPTVSEVAFAGRSNVGKSTLINSLVERKGLVRTSSTPGCTRQVNVFSIKARDELSLHFVDLPGYGFAKRSKAERKAWAQLIEGYLRGRPTLTALLVLVDVRRGIEPDDQELIDFIETAPPLVQRRPVEVIVVATKLDKLPRSQQRAALDKLRAAGNRPVLGYAAPTRHGANALWRAIRRAALGGEPLADTSTGPASSESSSSVEANPT